MVVDALADVLELDFFLLPAAEGFFFAAVLDEAAGAAARGEA